MTRGVRSPVAVCTVEGCDSPVRARGWCGRHYGRWKRHGDPLVFVRKLGDPDAVEKLCARCHLTKPVEEFWRHHLTRDGRQAWCKSCTNEATLGRYHGAPDRGWEQHLRRAYGITADEYDALLQGQQGLCAICGRPERRTYKGTVMRLVVDHDHVTGSIRGLLCHACNASIGHFSDDPAILRAAASYLERALA
jgi:hypothetical protein